MIICFNVNYIIIVLRHACVDNMYFIITNDGEKIQACNKQIFLNKVFNYINNMHATNISYQKERNL